jgi:hypothetical protein
MEVKIVDANKFYDAVSGEKCYLVVKVFRNCIGIGISQETNGDAEVYMNVDECEALIKWLQDAIHKVT